MTLMGLWYGLINLVFSGMKSIRSLLNFCLICISRKMYKQVKEISIGQWQKRIPSQRANFQT